MAESSKQDLVVDASFVLAYLMPSERTTYVDEVFENYKEGAVHLISSFLLPFEVLNGLRSAIIKKKLERKTAYELATTFLDLEIKLLEINFSETFNLAVSKDLSVYDASYLSLSYTRNLSLLTLDRRLKTLSCS